MQKEKTFITINEYNIVNYYNNSTPEMVTGKTYYKIEDYNIDAILGDKIIAAETLELIVKPLVLIFKELNYYINGIFLYNDSLIDLELQRYDVNGQNKFLLFQFDLQNDKNAIVRLAKSLKNLQYTSNYSTIFLETVQQILGVELQYLTDLESHATYPCANNELYSSDELYVSDCEIYETYYVCVKILANPNNFSNNIIKAVANLLLPQQQVLFIQTI